MMPPVSEQSPLPLQVLGSPPQQERTVPDTRHHDIDAAIAVKIGKRGATVEGGLADVLWRVLPAGTGALAHAFCIHRRRGQRSGRPGDGHRQQPPPTAVFGQFQASFPLGRRLPRPHRRARG